MGGYQKQGAEYTPLPKDFQGQRNQIWDFLGGDIGKERPGYPGAESLKAPNQLMDTGRLVSWLLTGSPTGGFDPTTGTMPMGRGGSFPSTGMGGMPMPAGWSSLGEAVSTDPVYQAMLAKTKLGIGTGVDQALQQAFGGGGSTQGTGLMRIAGDVGSRGMTEFGAGEMERQRQALETAKGRQQWMAGTELDQALSRANLGMSYTGAYQAAQQPTYQEWLRRQFENSPIFGALTNWGMSYPQQPQVPNMIESPFIGFLKSLLGAGATVAGTAIGKP